ncbi:PQQ-binding-like beta-propeller repeat protein [Thalassomonas haliotis]|uniref:PQQ-binding-like beta-propeller repeat protein n=1 Tax=Thalassomonas haliotis TaxID=485448 RepID=A0ABY7VJK5_9GAMM|nr:PQQ-binding-like beta-propeller repeat protein [Thalassomonas haliotis]WDE13665.1 PQQ-binding-like beta-propeller repeat protein [Thalassomonas haliotis]
MIKLLRDYKDLSLVVYFLLSVASLLAPTKAFAATEMCSSRPVTELYVGVSKALNLGSTWNRKYTSIVINGTSFPTSWNYSITASSSLLGQHTGVAKGTYGSGDSQQAIQCTFTVKVYPLTNPTYSWNALPSTVIPNQKVTLRVTANDSGNDLKSLTIQRETSFRWEDIEKCSASSVGKIVCESEWSSSQVKEHKFRAVAYDNRGGHYSSTKTIKVLETNTPPWFKSFSPSASNTTLLPGEGITISTEVADSNSDSGNRLKWTELCHGSSNKSNCNRIELCSYSPRKAIASCNEPSFKPSATTYIWAQTNDGEFTVKSDAKKLTIDAKPSGGISLSTSVVLQNKTISSIKATTSDTDIKKIQLCYGVENYSGTSCSGVIATCTGSGITSCPVTNWKASLTPKRWGIYAVFTDNNNQVSSSGAKTLTVTSGLQVGITSPSSGKSYTAGESISFTAKVEGLQSGALTSGLSKIELYANGSKVYSHTANICSNFISKSYSGNFSLAASGSYNLKAKVFDCEGNTSESGLVPITIKTAGPTIAPTVKLSTGSPSTNGRYNVSAAMVPNATHIYLYENGVSLGVKSGSNPSWTRTKSHSQNGTYTYCAKAWSSAGSIKGSGTKCKTMVVAVAEARPAAPKFNNISLQQTSAYTVSWPANDSLTRKFKLYGSKGSLANPSWQLIYQGSGRSFSQTNPVVGDYSYQLNACNSEEKCTAGQQMTVNHIGPYLQSAAFNSACGAHCLTLTGTALTAGSEVAIKPRNSTETFRFSGSNLSVVNASTLNVQTNNSVYEGLTDGGLTITVTNGIVNAPAATIVIDETGSILAAPQVTLSTASPSTNGSYTVSANLVKHATQVYLYENGEPLGYQTDSNSSWDISKSYEQNGVYKYCAKSWSPKGSETGTDTKCQTMVVEIPEALSAAPKLNALALQQASSYDLTWPDGDALTHHFKLYGSQGDLTNPNWQELYNSDGNSNGNRYQQKNLIAGKYSYQLAACNSEDRCVDGHQVTVEHIAPDLQKAELNSACGTNCFTLTGIALTADSKVDVQVRNSAETFRFSGHALNLVDLNTLNVQTNNTVKRGLDNGGLVVKVTNSVINAPSAMLVVDETGSNERIDLINHSPSLSDNGTIYVGVGEKIYALDPRNGETNNGWPYVTGGDVVATPTLGKDSQQQDLVYVGSKDFNFYALNQAGQKLWNTATRGEIIAPAELDQDNQLYVGSMDKALYALDARNGEIQWQYPLPEGISQKPRLFANGLIYVTTDDEQIHIIDRQDIGKYALKWQDIDNSLIRDSLDHLGNWQPPQDSVSDLYVINRLFYGVLDRAPTERELTFFAYASYMGMSLDEITRAFLLSDDGKANYPASDSNAAFLDKLYLALFQGFDYELVAGYNKSHWLAQLDGGQSRASVTRALIGSLEYGYYTNNAVLASWYYFYGYCELSNGCAFEGDSDNDGYSDLFEIEHGYNPLDPFDTLVEIPEISASSPQLGEFSLTITSSEQAATDISYYQLYQSIGDGDFVLMPEKAQISAAGTSTLIAMTKGVGNYRYQVKACSGVLCSQASSSAFVRITDSVIENAINPEPAPQVVAAKNAPTQDEINTSASYLMTSGSFKITENGTASFELPINLPQGIAGVTPGLSLAYDSQRGESSAGVGWSVSGGSAISRCRQTQAVDGQFTALTLDENDRYCLDGQRLILVDHDSTPAEGTVGAHYRTEIDNGLKITVETDATTGQMIFKVKGEDGSTRVYGGSENSETQINDVTITWLLRTTSDNINHDDNLITYSYLHDDIGLKEAVLSAIDYSGNRVALNYQSGRVRSSGYIQKVRTTASSELTGIEVYNHFNDNILTYDLSYEENNIGRRELKSIKECAGTVCKQPISFEYRPTVVADEVEFDEVSDVFTTTDKLANAIVQDVDGDGKNNLITLVHLEDKNYQLCIDEGNDIACLDFVRENADDQVPMVITDANGDGLMEILVNVADDETNLTDNWLQTEQVDGTLTELSKPDIVGYGYFQHTTSMRSFDFNGDGYNDLISIDQEAIKDTINVSYWDVSEQAYQPIKKITDFSSDNVSTSTSRGWFVNKDIFKGGWQSVDFNGDGLGDIIAWACDNSCSGDTQGDRLQIFTNTGDGLAFERSMFVKGKSLTSGDFNQDGFTDFLLFSDQSNRWVVYLNNDGGFINQSIHLGGLGLDISDEITPTLADVDSDGNLDLIVYAEKKWYRFEWSPEENQFVLDPQVFMTTGELDATDGDVAYFTDWDNNGRIDFLVKTERNVKAYMNLNAPVQPGLMSEVIQANGLDHSIEYGKMSDADLYEKGDKKYEQTVQSFSNVRRISVIGSSPLVKSVTSGAPSTNEINATTNVQYRYKGAQTMLGGRGWLGFAEISTISDKDGHTLTNTTKYIQDYPRVGRPYYGLQMLSGEVLPISENRSLYTVVSKAALNDLRYYQVYNAENRNCQANISRDSSLNYSVSDYLCSQTLTKENSDGDVISTVTSQYSKSDSGDFIVPNPYASGSVNTVPDGWLSQTEVTSNYIKPGRLSSTTTIQKRQGQDNIERNSAFGYYPEGHQHQDMLWYEEVEPEGDCKSYLKTSRKYDAWGNEIERKITNKADCEQTINRVVINSYDDEGRYLVSTANDSYVTNTVLARNTLGLALKSRNTDGLETDTVYDPFGNFVYRYNASGSQTSKLNKACSNSDCYMQVVSSTNGVAKKQDYVDMTGRIYRSNTVDVFGNWHSSYVIYDKYGRAIGKQAPGLLATEISYDIFDRKISESDPNTGLSNSAEVNGLVQTTTVRGDISGGSQVRIITLNAFGEKLTVEDTQGNVLTYGYNSEGKLISVHNSVDDVVTVKNIYDDLGRKIEMYDLDAGDWSYQYNALGQVVSQTDARGVKTVTSYDDLGRKTQQTVTGENTSYWRYNQHQLIEERSGDWQRFHYYDSLGRSVAVLTSLDNSTNCQAGVSYNSTASELRINDTRLNDPVSSRCVVQQTKFDSFGRIFQQFDDYRHLTSGEFIEARGVRYHYRYDQVFKQQEAREGVVGRIYNETLGINSFGGVSSYRKGAQIISISSDDAGRTSGISTGAGNIVQQDTFSYDSLSNLKSRELTTQSEQIFTYDNLNRVTHVNGTQLYFYQENGNFVSKDGWNHNYNETINGTAQPLHAITSRSKGSDIETFEYDENGNQISGKKNGQNWRAITYSGRNKASLIIIDGKRTAFSYDANNNRYKRVDDNLTVYYVGGLELTIQNQSNTLSQESYIKRYIAGQALQTYYSGGNARLKWLFKDNLGSLVAITNDQGKLLKRFSYDAFGKQQELIPSDVERLAHYDLNATMSVLSFVPMNIRGYTDHEPVGDDGRIIHMNGRIYDAALGRFLQADPVIQEPDNLQNYNRYSYVLNNPLTLTDPSGYSFFSKVWKKIKPFISVIVAAALVYFTGGIAGSWFAGSWYGAAAAGAISGAAGAAVNGGNILKGALTGAVSAAAFYGVGTAFQGVDTSFGSVGYFGKVAAHGLTGGVMAKLQGGKFSQGFAAAGVTQAFSRGIDSLKTYGARVTTAAILGGTASKLSGGKFANGAVTGAFSRMFNAEMHDEGFESLENKDFFQTELEGELTLELEGQRALGFKLDKDGVEFLEPEFDLKRGNMHLKTEFKDGQWQDSMALEAGIPVYDNGVVSVEVGMQAKGDGYGGQVKACAKIVCGAVKGTASSPAAAAAARNVQKAVTPQVNTSTGKVTVWYHRLIPGYNSMSN